MQARSGRVPEMPLVFLCGGGRSRGRPGRREMRALDLSRDDWCPAAPSRPAGCWPPSGSSWRDIPRRIRPIVRRGANRSERAPAAGPPRCRRLLGKSKGNTPSARPVSAQCPTRARALKGPATVFITASARSSNEALRHPRGGAGHRNRVGDSRPYRFQPVLKTIMRTAGISVQCTPASSALVIASSGI